MTTPAKLHKHFRTLLLPGLLINCFSVWSQFYNLPGENSFSVRSENILNETDEFVHTGIKPYIHFFSAKYVSPYDSTRILGFVPEGKLKNVLFYKHLVRVNAKDELFSLHIDPLLNFEVGGDLADSSKSALYTNTRGLIASGHIGTKFYFETMFSENQSVFPDYLSRAVYSLQVVPGQGRWKTFKTNGYDYAFSSGFVSLQPAKFLNIQVGHGKQKIGNGYRSLLLSDNSFNYPYVRFTQEWFKGRIQYSNIYAVLMNLVPASVVTNPNTERLFQKKAAAFQYLSINLSQRLNVSFFQGLIWRAGDEKNKQHLDWHYFNPLIYTNIFAYGLDDQNNILVGADLKYKLGKSLALYGQVMLDNLQGSTVFNSGSGFQAGINYYSAFSIKQLFVQVEYNLVQGSSYQNPPGAGTNQSYSHYNQTLAFTPLNGKELLFVGDYRIKRFFVNARYHLQTRNGDVATEQYQLSYLNAKLGYVINPSYNLNISVGMVYRSQNFSNFNASNNETNYIYLGFRTSIYNLYYDF